LAFVGDSTTHAPELYIKPVRGRATAVTSVNSTWTSMSLVAPEFVKYKSYDGVEIEGALLKPARTEARLKADTTAAPLVVLVHGGPTGRWSDSFEPWGQLLAARGYAVLYPNVRGSTGYGQKFVEMNRGDWGGGDFKDVMAGVDAMIARGIA